MHIFPKTTAPALVGQAGGCDDSPFEVSSKRVIIVNGLLADIADDTVGFVIAVM